MKTAAALIALSLLPCTRQSSAREPFRPTRVAPAFPAIQNAPFIPAAKAAKNLDDSELVLGVALPPAKGEPAAARAYPINMLTGPRREIINDTLAGTALAATW